MKVCLVSALTQPEAVLPLDGIADFDDAPVGVLTLAAILERQAIPLAFFDLDWEFARYRDDPRPGIAFIETIARKLAASESGIFGFSTICQSWPLTLSIAKRVKQLCPEAQVILGGPQATAVDLATLEAFSFVDFIVRGEADETFPRLIDCIDHRCSNVNAIPGVTYRRDGGARRTADPLPFTELNSLPVPAYHLYRVDRASRMALELGRGCPFACSFCSTNDFFRRRFRLVNPEIVLERMRLMNAAYGVARFSLVHDMFTVDRKAVAAFCETMRSSATGFQWSCSARTDCVDTELLRLLAEAGCSGIFFGIETGSPSLQKKVRKNLLPEDALQKIRTASSFGISTTASLIAGFPEETKSDFAKTVSFLLEAARDDNVYAQLHLLAPLSGTPIEKANRGSLQLDEISSDISMAFEFTVEERQWIESLPQIFSSFYHVPTPELDRAYVSRARAFLLDALERWRWLAVALHQVTGGLLDVFEAWEAFARTGDKNGNGDLFDFLAGRYGHYPAVANLLEFHRSLEQERERLRTYPEIDSEIGDWMYRGSVLHLSFDLNDLLDHLHNGALSAYRSDKESYVAIAQDGDQQKVINLHPLEASLLRLCDGRRDLERITQLADWSSWTQDLSISREHIAQIVLDGFMREGQLEPPSRPFSRSPATASAEFVQSGA